MLILASKSPRRKEILEKNNYEFKIVTMDTNECMDKNKTVYENVMNVAYLKGKPIHDLNRNDVVLSTDTIVTLDGIIYGKPKSKEDAYKMLKTFSGRTHEVVSGVSIISKNDKALFYVASKVTFKELSDQEIDEYLLTDEPYDKAGSYAIQGIARKFISNFEGSLNNIIGLPIEEIKPYLDRML